MPKITNIHPIAPNVDNCHVNNNLPRNVNNNLPRKLLLLFLISGIIY